MSVRELGPAETALGYRAMRELRGNLNSLDQFLALVNDVQRPQGYRLVAAFAEHAQAADAQAGGDTPSGCTDAVAVAGFRAGHYLSRGHCLYVDDLSTLPEARGRGHASRLLAWLGQEATRLGCEQIHLDSGTARHDAHRLYLSSGYSISAFHFLRPVRT